MPEIESKPKDITEVLNERGSRYGKFEGHARITQHLKSVIFAHKLRQEFDDDMVEALEMICHKIGRIINGDPNYVESWRDIVGYAQLVVNRLSETDGSTDAQVKQVTRINGAWV